jgi:hypothetical protein
VDFGFLFSRFAEKSLQSRGKFVGGLLLPPADLIFPKKNQLT